VFGGCIDDLSTFLIEERFPDGWEPKLYEANGLSILSYYRNTISKVENGIDEDKFRRDREERKNQRHDEEEGGEVLPAGGNTSSGGAVGATGELRRRV
jgi:hypothetical protein